MKKSAVIAMMIVTVILSTLRIYSVNHSEAIDYVPKKIVYPAGTPVELREGFYNVGHADLRGYYVRVDDSYVLSIDTVLEESGLEKDYLDQIGMSKTIADIFIIEATFSFEGKNNPLDNAIDLSSFRLVGPDYYVFFNTDINMMKNFNPTLQGNYMFSIGSGKEIKLRLPFEIENRGTEKFTADYVLSSNPMLLVSQYPEEVYIELNCT